MMSIVMQTFSATSLSSSIESEPITTPLEQAAVYLKDLRRAHKLTQSELAEAVEVGRGTIERLERGDDRISVGTVLAVLRILAASPWHYYDLAMQPTRTLDEIHHQRAVICGIAAYVRMLAERNQISLAVLDEVVGSPLASFADGAIDVDQVSPYALLLALLYLDAPLADLAPIVRAKDGHEALGQQLAEARGTFAVEMRHAQQHEQTEQHTVPALDVVVARIAAIIRYSTDLPTLLKHELSRVEADLKRYRALLARAVGDIIAEP
jgi:transcriptional regulator with XRE-family HTH domain